MWDDKFDDNDGWIETYVICDKCGATALWATTKTGIKRESIGDWSIIDIIKDVDEKDFFAELCPTCTKPILAFIEAAERKMSGDYCAKQGEDTAMPSEMEISDDGEFIEDYPVEGNIDGTLFSGIGDAEVYEYKGHRYELITWREDNDEGVKGEITINILPDKW